MRLLRTLLALALAASAVPPAKAARDDDASRWADETLKALSLRERIGQMVMMPLQVEFMNAGGERLAEIKRRVTELSLGGVVVRGGGPAETAALLNELQRASKLPLLVGADYEYGLRMQMKNGTPFVSNMGVAAAGDPRAAYEQARTTAEEARALGVNWLFGPVADINNNPDNPVINVRSFGEDPRRVAEFVAASVRGARDGGALSTVKHFPGHGDTAVDSHIGLPTIRADRARLERVELVPFRAAIEAGVDAVMTAHVALPSVAGDELPATLSPKVTTGLLRRELGFKGLVVTDSLSMGAVVKSFPGGEGTVRAVRAGADVALTPPDPKAAVDALEEAVKRGELSESRIDESVRKILSAKHRLGLVKSREVDPANVQRVLERPAAVAAAQRVAENSVTLLRNEGNLLPLDADRAARALFVVIAADDDAEEGRALVPQFKRRAPGARVMRADPRTTPAEYDAILAEAAKAELVLAAPFVKRAAGKGTVALPERQAEFLRRLVSTGKPVGVVAFGGPYLVRQFPAARSLAVAYGIEEVAQTAAARVLFGEAPFRGRLPVSVPGMFEMGSGIVNK
ncbi:MAG TPA: glycoside hydrolase family 3 N-terminal domain-containing protein [Pyrinomonadaceae bacterium]|jgi:beta-N-acetylhexosaminidase|nr:glycoside hydrolase family 3 N-terminal domain-containing protein [Pyrinomonadaceae bacterium]